MRSVLIADDDPQFRKLVRKILEKENFKVFEASNGEDCLKIYQKESPPVVLIDIVMPLLDGVSVISEIKKQDSHTKIIAVSGGAVFVPKAYLDEAKLAGAHRTISKPIDIKELLAAIEIG